MPDPYVEKLMKALDALAVEGDGTVSLHQLLLAREAAASVALDKDDRVQTLHHFKSIEDEE
jgi:hypothetical protein